MPKNKRQNKAPAPSPVMHGNAFHTFIAEAQSIGNEVAARRLFDADVCEYLELQGKTKDFEAWRANKRC